MDMTDDLTAILREHRKSAANEWGFVRLNKGIGYLQPFLTGRDKWPKDLCRKVGVKPVGCHGVRALTATLLAQGNVPMVAIKQHLRHKNHSVTEAYVRGIASIRPHLRVLESGGSAKRKMA